MKNKTIFEKIVDKETPAKIVYEDNNFLAFLDIQPKVLGHTLVITKKPYKNILEIPDEINGKYMNIIKKISNAVKKATDADGFNLIMNNESAAGQQIFHAHMHIIPRFKNDNIDMNQGTGHKKYSSEKEIENYRKKIKENI